MFARFSRAVSDAAGHPLAFLIALAVIVLWAALGPLLHFSEVWQLTINTATTVVTFLMVFVIQSSQNRDTRAIQDKLDELVRATENASDAVIGEERRDG